MDLISLRKLNMDNPPQITWESLLKQRFYDAINAQGTERETQVIDIAILEMQKEIQELARLNRGNYIRVNTSLNSEKPPLAWGPSRLRV